MNKEKIFTILCMCIEKQQEEIKDISLDSNLLDVGLDSLKFIKFIVTIEEEFNIEVLDSDLLACNFETLSKLYQTLQKYFIN